MRFYFVAANKSSVEIEVLEQVQPPRLLCSYHYFRNKPLSVYMDQIGYRPEIMLDSGAYSAYTSGKQVNLDDYCAYIEANKDAITDYVSLDILGDSAASLEVWQEMRRRGFDPIPVFHYEQPEHILEAYLAAGAKRIALGGTVPIRNKAAVAEWIRLITWQYPAQYHLLGSSSRRIINHCDIESADASTWIIGAIVGRPRSIPGTDRAAKLKRAIYNMRSHLVYETAQDGSA